VESDLSDSELATFATSWLTAEYMLNRADAGARDRVLVTGAFIAKRHVGNIVVTMAGGS